MADLFTTRSRHGRVAAGVVAVGVPIVIAAAVPHDVRTNIPAGLMLLGIAAAAVLGGLVWGCIAAALSVTVLAGFFLGRPGAMSWSSDEEIAAAVVYFVVAFGVALVIDALRRRLRTEERARATLAAELAAERRVLGAMQIALLPKEIVHPAHVDLCVRYRPADELARIGGDWYAIVPLPDGTVGLGIGDVAGNGLPAIALMAEVRYALRTLAFGGTEPDEVLRLLNEQVCEFEQDAMVTALYGVYDPQRSSWRQAVAGHPPALVRSGPDATYLAGASGPPLGFDTNVRFELDHTDLPRDATLVLYTDGLVERRGELIDAGLARLRSAALATDPEPRAVCDHLLTTLLGSEAHDDVAVLAARIDLDG